MMVNKMIPWLELICLMYYYSNNKKLPRFLFLDQTWIINESFSSLILIDRLGLRLKPT